MKTFRFSHVLVCSVLFFLSNALYGIITDFPSFSSFETGWDLWEQSPSNDFNMSRNAGQTPSSGTGPSGAYDGNWYVYTEASGNNPNLAAAIQTECDFSSLGNPAISFYYHMYGANMGSLHVDVYTGAWVLSEWSLSGEQQTAMTVPWREASVNISSYAGMTSVVLRIRGVTGAGYTSDICVDYVRVFDNIPRVDVTPFQISKNGAPSDNINTKVHIKNMTGDTTAFNIYYFNDPWTTLGPVTTSSLTNEGWEEITVQVQIPSGAYDGDCATSMVQVISTDGMFTGTIHILSECKWETHPLPCETWDIFPHGWTNYALGSTVFTWLQSGIGNPAPGLYHPAYTANFTNWFVSPAINLNDSIAEEYTLSFDEFVIINDGYDYTGVYISDGNKNPLSNDYVELLEIGDSSLNWKSREIDLTAYKGISSAYLAFVYIGSNSHLPFIDNVCIKGVKKGIDSAFLDMPVSTTVVCGETGPACSGRIYIAGETGSSGPAPRVSGYVGIGPQGTIPMNNADWLWFPAAYSGASGMYDVYDAQPNVCVVGEWDVAYRYRVGEADWVYADRNGSTNGYDTAQAGKLTVLPRPVPGAVIYEQTMDGFAWYESVAYSNANSTASLCMYDDFSVAVDTRIDAVRWHGVYSASSHRGDVLGFNIALYHNEGSNSIAAFDHPGSVVYSTYTSCLACETVWSNLYGYAHYTYTVEFPSPLSIGPGDYWVSVQVITDKEDFDWYILNTEDPVKGSPSLFYQDNIYYQMTRDIGFQLFGAFNNYGIVTGKVSAAHSGNGIEDATVSFTGLINIITDTDVDGAYYQRVPLGTYTPSAWVRNYATNTPSEITLSTEGEVIAQNFALTGSVLTYAPSYIERVLHVGDVVTNTVWLTNSGPNEIDISLGITDYAVATSGVFAAPPVALSFAPKSPVHIPRFEGEISSDSSFHSIEKPPEYVENSFVQPSYQSIRTGTRGASPIQAYGTEITGKNMISFYTDTPGTHSNLFVYGSDAIWASDFIPTDVHNVYAIYADNTFAMITMSNGTVHILGTSEPSDGLSWTGMAGDPDGSLYACATDVNYSELYRIDVSDGTATRIGEIDNAPGIIAIAINALGEMYGYDIVNNTFLSINKYTGAGTVIGPLGFDANFGQGMDFDYESGICYLAAFNQSTGPELRIADITTGATSNIGAFAVGQVGSMAVPHALPETWATLSTHSVTLSSGAVSTCEIVFDSNFVSNKGTYTANCTFFGSFVNQAPQLPLTMHIADSPHLEVPLICDAGGAYMNGTSSVPLTVKNIGVGVITGCISHVTHPFFVTGTTNYILGSLESEKLMITFAPDVTGTFSCTALLSGANGGSCELTGYTLPTIKMTPQNLTFPMTEIGESNQMLLICENIGGEILYGSATSLTNPFTLVGTTHYAIPALDFTYYSVWFAPESIGDFTQTVVFTGGGDAHVVVSGYGVPEPVFLPIGFCICIMCMRRRKQLQTV